MAGIERAIERLGAVPVSDLAAWRGAARESRRRVCRLVETLRRGQPWAAGGMRRRTGTIGAEPTGRSRAESRRGGATSVAVAAIVAQSQLSNDSPMVWAMLIDQLSRTLRVIADAHAARGETTIAKALVDRLSSELTELHKRFETTSTRDLVPKERTFEGRMAQTGAHSARHSRHHRGRGPSQGRGFGR